MKNLLTNLTVNSCKLKATSEIRKDYFLNRFVLITPCRALRPRDIKEQTLIAKDEKCQFCPENINVKNIQDKISQGKGYSTRIGQRNWENIE